MMEPTLINSLSSALSDYRNAIARTRLAQEKEDYLRLAAISEKVIAAMQNEDLAGVKINVLGFSRQVSDAFSTQPPEFKALAQQIAKIKKLVV